MSVGEDCLVLVDYFYNAWGDWWMSMREYRPMKRGVMVYSHILPVSSPILEILVREIYLDVAVALWWQIC